MNNLDIIIKKINSFSRKNNYHKRMGSIYYDRLYEEADYICKKLSLVNDQRRDILSIGGG